MRLPAVKYPSPISSATCIQTNTRTSRNLGINLDPRVGWDQRFGQLNTLVDWYPFDLSDVNKGEPRHKLTLAQR